MAKINQQNSQIKKVVEDLKDQKNDIRTSNIRISDLEADLENSLKKMNQSILMSEKRQDLRYVYNACRNYVIPWSFDIRNVYAYE